MTKSQIRQIALSIVALWSTSRNTLVSLKVNVDVNVDVDVDVGTIYGRVLTYFKLDIPTYPTYPQSYPHVACLIHHMARSNLTYALPNYNAVSLSPRHSKISVGGVSESR